MNQVTHETEPGSTDASGGGAAASDAPSPSRRRLIKLGTVAVPVVATLASRPALAWHCQSPSAWGSEQMNPNTSLRTNAGHQSYPDETWYISNWAGNTTRSGTAYTGKPWDKFFSKYSSIRDLPEVLANYKMVTIAHLQSKGFNCGTASPTAKAYEVLSTGSDLQKATIVAQLNFKCLSPYTSNQMEECLSFGNLQAMASGSYSPSGSGLSWNAVDIVKYLKDNYIAVP